MIIPKLHFKYAFPFDRNRRQLFSDKNLGPYPSIEEVENKVCEWRDIWENLNAEDKVFKSIIEVTGVNLPRDLEMCIFGAGMSAMSSPLMMPIADRDGKFFTDDKFIETTIHEVVHRFVGDYENNSGIENYWEAIRKEYSGESILTQNHIIIYAVLDAVLMELFSKGRTEDFIHPKHPDYQRAFVIVSENGSGKLIKQFRMYLK
ncbi:hypothetical protein BWK69_01140 [Candidatus Parcubacteria bacterium A4]|nr:MAG: hypothetical protein BWK69_01140 [Candidatus Parcubacteria bacterium A4]